MIVDNSTLLTQIEQIFLSKRSYVFKPPVNEDTVFLLTGGIDSSILLDLYLDWTKTGRIFPLYIRRSAKAEPFEIGAARQVITYLQKRTHGRLANLQLVSAEIPPLTFKQQMNLNQTKLTGYKVRNTILVNYAAMYGFMLNDQGADVHTIVIGKVASDFFTGSRKEDIRLMMLQVCLNTEDWQWQVISPAFESSFYQSLGFTEDLTKTNLVKIGLKRHFPLPITRTCTNKTKIPCGQCEECKERNSIFSSLHINY